MELVLKQTQQGTSYEVLVSAEGVEELKKKVKIKGEKKEAILTLRQKLDKIKVVFNQARREEASFEALMRDVCYSLWVSLSKKRRLAVELEALREQGDVVKALENMKEIVSRNSVMLADLE
ncbi:hypothetical protein Tco_0603870 [Tanacetum coccineum]